MQVKTQEFGWYLRNSLLGPDGGDLIGMIETFHSRMIDGDEEEYLPESVKPEPARAKRRRKGLEPSIEKRQQTMRSALEDFAEAKVGLDIDAATANAGYAQAEFGLSNLDLQILLIVLRYSKNNLLEDYADAVLYKIRSPAKTFACLLGVSEDIVRQRLSSGAPLIDSGILTHDPEGEYLAGSEGAVQVSRTISNVMLRQHAERSGWCEALLGRPMTPNLVWDDFAHLGDQANLARRLMTQWTPKDGTGINICIVGPPGTGKTEFAITLADCAKRRIWSVGEKDDDGDEPTRLERMAALRLTMALLRSKEDTVLLLDEAEDVLESGNSSTGKHDISKAYLNRLLNGNVLPVIWTCNSVEDMDPAVLRRMSMIIEMKLPDRPVRQRIWERVLERSALELPEGAAGRLALRWAAPPAIAANAARVARITGGGEEDVETALFGVMSVMEGGLARTERDGSAFDPDLIVCSENLETLVSRLTRPGKPLGWTMCLDGPSGTGKSEFARYLAGRMGIPVVHKRASDMLSKWANESEQKIAAAFAEAHAKRAMLIIDEVDSMIMSRENSTHNHEVNQVNEILTWMDDLSFPFVCTTNLVERIDKASLRRFTFKLKLRSLDHARAKLAFKRILGCEAPGELPDGMAPGDFAVVRNKAKLMEETNPWTLLSWLHEEAAAKNPLVRTIGFAGTPRHIVQMARENA